MKTFPVVVEHSLTVSLDESKFTPEWLAEFRGSFYPFETIEEHARHLGQLAARGVYDFTPGQFIEGYGPVEEMGISVREDDVETFIE